jgi:hypothetical protein
MMHITIHRLKKVSSIFQKRNQKLSISVQKQENRTSLLFEKRNKKAGNFSGNAVSICDVEWYSAGP